MANGRDGGDEWNDPLADIDFEEFELGEHSSHGDVAAGSEVYTPQPPAMVTCPSCGAGQPATNLHCEQCGARLSKAELPVAPRPLSNVTAGTRALTVILAVLAGVVILALGFQIFGSDDDTATGDTTNTAEGGSGDSATDGATSTTLLELQPIRPIKIECSTQFNDNSLACSNLIDGDDDTIWNDNALEGEGAIFTVTFSQPVALEQVTFTNVVEDERFRKNWRINGVQIIANDLSGLPLVGSLPNENTRDLVVQTRTLGTTELRINVVSTYPSESIGGKAFDELALAEIEFWGRLVETVTPSSTTATTSG